MAVNTHLNGVIALAFDDDGGVYMLTGGKEIWRIDTRRTFAVDRTSPSGSRTRGSLLRSLVRSGVRPSGMNALTTPVATCCPMRSQTILIITPRTRSRFATCFWTYSHTFFYGSWNDEKGLTTVVECE